MSRSSFFAVDRRAWAAVGSLGSINAAVSCFVAALVVLAAASCASAAGDQNQWLDVLLERGESAIGRRIRLERMRCADTGGAGLVCQRVHRGRIVAVGAKTTGPRTPKDTSLRLSEDCVGLVSFGQPRCDFDVYVTPSSIARGTMNAGKGKRPLVQVGADSFDLF